MFSSSNLFPVVNCEEIGATKEEEIYLDEKLVAAQNVSVTQRRRTQRRRHKGLQNSHWVFQELVELVGFRLKKTEHFIFMRKALVPRYRLAMNLICNNLSAWVILIKEALLRRGVSVE